jgi:hypothetical protein
MKKNEGVRNMGHKEEGEKERGSTGKKRTEAGSI